MSLNNFMHLRNKYKTEPDFKSLAVKDPEFRKIAIVHLNGKVTINFKDKNSLIVLTKTLLKYDFNLNVDIPPIKLVPALPLRLNYILWIEDIINFEQCLSKPEIHGIDIGVGAICIYPLLIARQYGWKITGTEIDSISLRFARENIQKNNLEHLINVMLVNPESILREIVKESDCFTFVMCNPPFFNFDDVKKLKKNPARNASTGCDGELITEGGEQTFISRLIDESLKLKKNIKIFTTMCGKKSTLNFVKRELACKNITNTTWTEFCQGYTKRWGIAWTFLPEKDINLKNAPVIRMKRESSKNNKDFNCTLTFPKTEEIPSLDKLNYLFKKFVAELHIEAEIIDLGIEDYDCYAYQLIAYKDNWSHARRKRRMAMMYDVNRKKSCIESNDIIEGKTTSNDLKTDDAPQDKVPYVKCNVLLQLTETDNEEEQKNAEEFLRVHFIFEDGTGGKQALETLRQFFMNKFNCRKYIINSNRDKSKKKKP